MNNNTHKGFSLIELMATVAIAGIVMGMAVPTLISSTKNNRLTTQINTVVASLFMTRNEAAKQSDNMLVMCGSTDATTCDTSSWESGWIIFVDEDGDNSHDASEELIKVVGALAGANTLRTTGFNNSAFITFNNQGSPTSTGTFMLCDSRGADLAKAVVLSRAGYARLAVDEDNDNTVNTHSGSGSNASCPS